MEYKVVPFHPTITDKGSSEQAAKELQNLIQSTSKEGWNFISLESISTTVRTTGCSGFFSPPVIRSVQLVIFGK